MLNPPAFPNPPARTERGLRPTTRSHFSSAALAGGLALLLAGCATIERKWDVPDGPAFVPANHTSAGPLPSTVRRVGLLPLHADSWNATTLQPLDDAFAAELGKTGRFEVVRIPRSILHDWFGHGSFDSTGVLPESLPARLRSEFGLDAILLVDLTRYSPYAPVALGVRAKLMPLDGAGVLWSFDEVFDGAQPGVSVAARKYYLDHARPAMPHDDPAGILLSPARFSKFVAWTTFGTLPVRRPSM